MGYIKLQRDCDLLAIALLYRRLGIALVKFLCYNECIFTLRMKTDMNMLRYIPKTLQEDFINNRVVPLIGSGFSKNGIISTREVIPDWNELGKAIAQYLPNYTYTNALDAISLFESEFSRGKLIEILAKEIKVNRVQPGKAHQALVNLLFDTICTTNFDFLIEQALTEQKIPFSTIISEERLAISTEELTKVIKLHGDFNHPNNMVLTENDYDNFVERNKVLSTYISNLFITKTLLIVGYSLDDTDIRTLWSVIGSRLGKLRSNAYAVLVDASPLEISRFARRNVKVINITGSKSNYSNLLTDFFITVKEVIDNKIQERTIFMDDKVVEEQKIQDSNNRLCFISAPSQRMSFLNEMLRPVLSELGLTSVTINEAISPGDTLIRKIDTLINQSGVVIVDVSESTPNVLYELGIAMERNKKIILVAEEKMLNSIPIPISGFTIHTYSYYEKESLSLIRSELEDYLKSIDDSISKLDAEHLLEQGEYTAAVIMAFRQLEIYIYNHLPYKNKERLGHIAGTKLFTLMRPKTDNALQQLSKFDEYRTIRNKLVHTNYKISKKQANEIIRAINLIYDSIQQNEILLVDMDSGKKS